MFECKPFNILGVLLFSTATHVDNISLLEYLTGVTNAQPAVSKHIFVDTNEASTLCAKSL